MLNLISVLLLALNVYYRSFIIVNENTRFSINNGDFQYINSYEKGSVLMGKNKNSITEITHSHFKYNAAIDGGIFAVQIQSLIK
jgi:hypothetical protein